MPDARLARSFFITGSDTAVGKTLIAEAILHATAARGLRVLGIKPVSAGCERLDGRLFNGDAVALQAASSGDPEYSLINPVALEPFMAPHIAAVRAGVTLSARDLADHCRDAREREVDLLIIEGAGGWLVPLNDAETMADICRSLQIPVILVVDMKLGCLNHALLTVESIVGAGLDLAGWVANSTSGRMDVFDENLATLRERLPAPLLGVIPFAGAVVSARSVAHHLDIDPLLRSG